MFMYALPIAMNFSLHTIFRFFFTTLIQFFATIKGLCAHIYPPNFRSDVKIYTTFDHD